MMTGKNSKLCLYVITSLCFLSCKAQQSADNAPIKIEIVDDSILMETKAPELEISVLCTNKGTRNLLLYGFESNVLTVAVNLQDMCDGVGFGAGVAALVYNDAGKREYGTFGIPAELRYTPMTKDRFRRLMAESRQKYLSGTKVVNAMDSSTAKLMIPLQPFHLVRGTYWLELMYYSGDALEEKVVGATRMQEDRIQFDADVFQGCVTSNRVKFVVY